MNITKQVLENINSLLFEVNLDENTNELLISMYITKYKSNDILKTNSDLFFTLLNKKYNGDFKSIFNYLINLMISSSQITKLEIFNENNDYIEMERMVIKLNNSKEIIISTPIKCTYEELNENIKEFLKDIKYYELKKQAEKDSNKNLIQIFNKNEFDNIIICDVKNFNGCEALNINDKTTLLCFSNNNQHNLTRIKLTKKFIEENINKIEEFKMNYGRITMKFSNGKSLEISDEEIKKALKDTINQTENKLIDIKIKQLKKPNTNI